MTGFTFGLLSGIDLANPASWRHRVFMTLDVDWASDAVLTDALDLLDAHEVPATVFVTHDTPLLARLRGNPRLELGIHPNFNPLLDGDPRCGATIRAVLDRLLTLVPEARSLRSHSLTTSTPLIEAMAERGLAWESNILVPWHAGMPVRPWRSPNPAVLRIPITWADDVQCREGLPFDPAPVLAAQDFHVFAFHPIHLTLNTDTPDRYARAKPFQQDAQRLQACRNTAGPGVRSFFTRLATGI